MKFHRLVRNDDATAEFFSTQVDLKNVVKEIPKGMRELAFIDEIEVPTDKDGVLNMLSYVGRDFGNFTVLRTFGLTPRGALEEIKE